MPRGDGTGPMGDGSMTGRAAGYCAGYQAPGYMNPVLGRGFGRGGGGRGLGFRRGAGWGGFRPAVVPFGVPAGLDEKQYLKVQSKMLQDQLENIQKRIDELADQQAQDK